MTEYYHIIILINDVIISRFKFKDGDCGILITVVQFLIDRQTYK